MGHTEATATSEDGFKSRKPLVLEEHPSAPGVAVMSDTHIGDSASWMETDKVQEAVTSYFVENPSVGTLVLLGDTLDLTFGTLGGTINGRGYGKRPGLRAFLKAVCSDTKIDRIIYVPGNHDYVIWDWEVRERIALTPLRNGDEHDFPQVWCGVPDRPFLGGLIPKDHADEVAFDVTFPHCVAAIAGHNVVLTHGHWFDKVQTAGVLLSRLKEEEHPISDLAQASAQYQTIARAIAIRRETRLGLHGLYKWAAGIWDWAHARWESVHGLRHTKSLSADTVREINAYLDAVVKEINEIEVSALVFGHTHTSGYWQVDPPEPWAGPRPFPIYNSGSFVPRPGEKATLLVLHPDGGEVAVDRISFEESGKYGPEPFGTAGCKRRWKSAAGGGRKVRHRLHA